MTRLSLFFLAVLLIFSALWRLLDLSRLPAGFYWDEQDVVYQAYSLRISGRDYFGNGLPLFPHSFSDYRTPLPLYLTVPFQAIWGLTPMAARLPVVLASLLTIICLWLLSWRLFRSPRWALLPPLLISLSPWHFTYSRMAFEMQHQLLFILLSLLLFLKSLKSPRFWPLAAVFLGLSLYTYSTSKLFLPLMLIILLWTYRRFLPWKYPSITAISSGLFLIISVPALFLSTFGPAGTRFHDISVFTDPGITEAVSLSRLSRDLSGGRSRQVGMAPDFMDKLLFNKPAYWANWLVQNYVRSYSPQFLFLSGDTLLRHSPGKDTIGQLLPADFPLFILGVGVIFFTVSVSTRLWLFSWLLLAPFPAALTRDGGAHASRTFLLLPIIIILISFALHYLSLRSRWLVGVYTLITLFSWIAVQDYYFHQYRFESMQPYHWGYENALITAQKLAPQYRRVIVDFASESPLMAYLTATAYPPQTLAHQLPFTYFPLAADVAGPVLNNFYLLPPGSRNWSGFVSGLPSGPTLLVASASVPGITRFTPFTVIRTPDDQPAFYFINL